MLYACTAYVDQLLTMIALSLTVYLIFFIWDIFEVIVIYFVVVETKGLTLEEINEVFEKEHPMRYSEQLQREIRESRRRHE